MPLEDGNTVGSFTVYDTDAVERGIRSLVERAPPFETAGIGHGTPFTSDGSERLAAVAERL